MQIVFYVGLWLVFLVPAIVRDLRGERVPKWMLLAILVTGLFMTVELGKHH